MTTPEELASATTPDAGVETDAAGTADPPAA